MPQIVLRAEPGDYAPLVLLPGDPGRARRIADRLDAPRCVTDHRGLVGYTGTLGGRPVSVQATGMGTPSMAIVAEELIRLGAQRLVRVGTCGAIGRGIERRDLVVAVSAAPTDGATRSLVGGDPFAPTADFEMTRAVVDRAREQGLTVHVGPVATVDLLYNPDPDWVARWRSRGILAFEMEAAVLFYLAARASAAGADVRAACLLTVSDVLTEDVGPEETYLPLDELERATERMIEVALTASLP